MEDERQARMPRSKAREQWLTEILDRFERPLVRYAHRRLGDLELARDVAQECFLRLCRAEPAPGDAHVAPWLYRVCRNLTVDHHRKNGRVHALASPDHMTDPARRPDQKAERRDQADRMTVLIEDLPDTQQEVLRLRFQDGLSYRQISEITGASISHVGVLLHTALGRLRSRMVDAPLPPALEGRSS